MMLTHAPVRKDGITIAHNAATRNCGEMKKNYELRNNTLINSTLQNGS